MLFVKDRHTFSIKSQCIVLSLDPLVYDATEDTTSNIVVPTGGITNDDINCFAVFDDEPGIWLIKGLSQNENDLNVTLEPVWRIFSRDHIWSGDEYDFKGEFLADIIQNEYIDQTDSFYAYPYMTVSSLDTTGFKVPTDEAGDIFSLADYAEDAVKSDNIQFLTTYTRESIDITICQRPSTSQTVLFNDGHTLFEGSSFGDGAVGKVTVLQNGETTDYYLNSSNIVVTTVPADRVDGEWKLISVGDDDDEDAVQSAVDDEFKETINSYKIEWASDRELSVGDDVRFQLEGGSVHFGKVTYKSKKSSDGLYHYKSGSLKTTLTDKVRSVK